MPDFGRRRYKGFEDKHPFLKYEKIMKMPKRGRVRRRIRTKDSLSSDSGIPDEFLREVIRDHLAEKQQVEDPIGAVLLNDVHAHLESDTQTPFDPSTPPQRIGIMGTDLAENSATEESNFQFQPARNMAHSETELFTIPEGNTFPQHSLLSPEASFYSPRDLTLTTNLDLSQSLEQMLNNQPLSIEENYFANGSLHMKLNDSVDLLGEDTSILDEPSVSTKETATLPDLPTETSSQQPPSVEFDHFLREDNENIFPFNNSLASLWNQEPIFENIQLPIPTIGGVHDIQLERNSTISSGLENGESLVVKSANWDSFPTVTSSVPKTPIHLPPALEPAPLNYTPPNLTPEKTDNSLDPKVWLQEEVDRGADLDKLAREYYRLANSLPVPREEAEHDIIDRPNKCPLCPRGYSQKGKLKAHIMKCHPNNYYALAEYFPMKVSKEGKKYPCPVEGCMSGFSQVCSYNRHMRTVHPGY